MGKGGVIGPSGKEVSCFAYVRWLLAHPIGQLIILFLIILPLGIYSIVIAQDSYDKLDSAVGKFNDLIDMWEVKTLTALEVKNAGSSCSAGYEKFATLESPAVASGLCACPGLAWQPFNQASTSQINTAVSNLYGYGRRRRGSPAGPEYLGEWQSSYCYTDEEEPSAFESYTQYQTSGGSRRRMSNSGSGSSYSGSKWNGMPACTSNGHSDGSDLGWGGSSQVSVDGSGNSGTISVSDYRCFIEEEKLEEDQTSEGYTYKYTSYSTYCTVIPKQLSALSSCTTDQAQMRCTQDAATASFVADEWRDKVICAKRDGAEAITTDGVVRPDPDADCPDGYTKCGSGDYNTDKATCTPSGTECPLTNIKIYDSTSSDYVSTDWDTALPLTGNYLLVSRNANKTSTAELPVAATWLGFDQRCVSDSDGLTDYGYSGDRSSLGMTVGYSGSCSNPDSRWNQVDSQTAKEFLQDNFDTQCSSSSGAVRSWTDLTAVTVSSVVYYIYNVVGSGMNANSATYCDTGDSVCSTIMNRNMCAKMTSWADSSSNTGLVANPYWQEENFFKLSDECVTKGELFDSKSKISHTKKAVLTQLILQYITLVVGFVIALVVIFIDYRGMHDDSDSDDMKQVMVHRGQNGTSACLQVATMITIIIAYIAALDLGSIYEGNDKCTDVISATNSGFSVLADTINDVQDNSVINLVIGCLLIAFCIFSIATATAFTAERIAQPTTEAELEPSGTEDKVTANAIYIGDLSPPVNVSSGDDGRIKMRTNDTPSMQQPTEQPVQQGLGEWQVVYDEQQQPYYSNPTTNATQWEKPGEMEHVAGAQA